MQFSSHNTYINEHGIEVPSATTVLKILNKPALVKWANYLGFKHMNVDQILHETSNLGTLVHDLVSSILSDDMIIYIPDDNIPDSLLFSYLKSFKDWYNVNNIESIFLEKSFASEKVGGTVDCYCKLNGKLTILDFKTSKKIRINMFFQLAIYCILLEDKGYEIEQVGILLVNDKYKGEKYLSRKEMDKYIVFVRGLIDLFHSYYDINNEDKWNEIII